MGEHLRKSIMTTRTVDDELDSIIRMFGAKYPHRSGEELDALVHDVYAHLASTATVTAHLIPLTVNRCHNMLNSRIGVS
jgi:Mg2+ and Co2+ transporter CorA